MTGYPDTKDEVKLLFGLKGEFKIHQKGIVVVHEDVLLCSGVFNLCEKEITEKKETKDILEMLIEPPSSTNFFFFNTFMA